GREVIGVVGVQDRRTLGLVSVGEQNPRDGIVRAVGGNRGRRAKDSGNQGRFRDWAGGEQAVRNRKAFQGILVGHVVDAVVEIRRAGKAHANGVGDELNDLVV